MSFSRPQELNYHGCQQFRMMVGMVSMRGMICWFRRHGKWLLVGCLSFWISTLAWPALGQLPSLADASPAATNNANLPAGVLRFGDLEVMTVHSPYTDKELFQIAAPTVLERANPPASVLPVELRAADIEGRLQLVFSRMGALDNPPQINRSTLNQTPILVISNGQTSRSLALVTVTEQDSAFYGQTRQELAQVWQEILQAEVDRVHHLNQPDTLRRRLIYGLNILLGLLAFSLLVWLLRRLLNKRQKFLRQQKQEEDKLRANLLANTAAQHEKQTMEVAVEARESREAMAAASPDIAPPPLAATDQAPPPDNMIQSVTAAEQGAAFVFTQHKALLASLRQQFTFNRRIRFYTLLKWCLFWGSILVWYVGIFAISSTVPFLMRWRFWILSKPLELIFIWFVVGMAIRLSHAVIDASTIKRFSTAIPSEFTANPAEEQRRELQASTITTALEGLATVGFIVAGILWTLNTLNLSTQSILAGGAILGLAISFGSQSLVKDVVNGSLILLEDQFAIGDVVAIDGDSGVVENVNLRVTQIRNTQGELITIPNSAISRVKNMTRLWSRVDFAIEVAYENNIDKVINLLDQVAQTMYQESPWSQLILEPPEMLGVDQLSHTGMLLRIWIKTAPMQQWAVGREYRRRVRRAFEQHQIQIGRPEWISYNTGWNGPDGDSGAENASV
jgi:small-conductance mechanosensitive channel